MLTREQIEEANKQIKTIPLKGKEYAQVNERIKAFRAVCPGGQITTDILSMADGVVTMKATITDEEGRTIATGMAQEKESSSFINKTSYIENCETSAIGRALMFAGIGGDGQVASAEELVNAIMNQDKKDSGYPPRKTMIEAIEKKYPTGTDYYTRLCESIGVPDLVKATNEQIMAVYNRITK